MTAKQEKDGTNYYATFGMELKYALTSSLVSTFVRNYNKKRMYCETLLFLILEKSPFINKHLDCDFGGGVAHTKFNLVSK